MNDEKNLNQPIEIEEEQLEQASGGSELPGLVTHVACRVRCKKNPEHVYMNLLDACPKCGCTERIPY